MKQGSSLMLLKLTLLGAIGAGACGAEVDSSNNAAGSGAGTSAGTSASSSSGGGAGPTVCEGGGEPVMALDGQYSGFKKCPDGTLHRADAVACNPDVGIFACDGTEIGPPSCATDADCTAKPNGHCGKTINIDLNGLAEICGCIYPCTSDAACDAGNVCVCAGVVPANVKNAFCAPAGCLIDSACPSEECGISSYDSEGCGYWTSLSCRSAADECRLAEDCAPGEICEISLFNPGPWACVLPGCAIGRPLLVEGSARTAPVRDDDKPVWSADLRPSTEGLSAQAREALAAHWSEVAALEHASVASFARFTLQLLALGAPPSLVAASQAASLDEVEHAKMAYALAGAYRGAVMGPGPLDLQGITISTDRAEVLASLVVEGCVGETLGAAEARALAEEARDPAIRAALHRIAGDEERHAALAYQALTWLLGTGGSDGVAIAEMALSRAIDAMTRDPKPPLLEGLDGMPRSAAWLKALREQVTREVVMPCWAAAIRVTA